MPVDRTEVLGRRIGAALLDIVLLTLVAIVVGLLLGDTETGKGRASVQLGTAGTLVWLVLSLLYYGAMEAATGQTVGKRLLGVRVVRLDGARPTPGNVAARTVLRIIDALPLAYLLGLVVVLVTGDRRQRLGDLAGGTTVAAA